MKTRKFSACLRLHLIIVTVLWASPLALAQGSGNPDPPGRMRSMTRAQRKAARLRAAPQGKGVSSHFAGLNPETAVVSPLAAGPNALAAMTPGASPDYFGVGNYANSAFPVISPGPILLSPFIGPELSQATCPVTSLQKFVAAGSPLTLREWWRPPGRGVRSCLGQPTRA